MRYDSYRYIEPPRAEAKVMEVTLDFYEKRKWLAQVKKNGTNSVIYVPPKFEGRPFAKTRHPEDPDHKVWEFSQASIKAFTDIQGKSWHVFNVELLHSKGNGIRDTNYVHDVLVYAGTYLVGSTVQQRQDILQHLFDTQSLKGPNSHLEVNKNTWIVKNHKRSFRNLFARLENEDEGLVLKNPEGKLLIKDNASWAVKCRHPNKNLGF